jgi:hypothetical protein
VKEDIGKVDPDDHVPVALPSSAGGGGAAKSWRDRVPAGIVVEVANWGDHRYMLEPVVSVKDPVAWTIASQSIPHLVDPVPNAQDWADWAAETILYSAPRESPVPVTV